MSSEATSSLDFSDLLIEVAYKLGIAYYGPNGDQAAQVPIDAHDLDLCQRIVNKGIRMFIHDAPAPNGWRWQKPIAQIDMWPTISADTTNKISTATYNAGTGVTTLIVPNNPSFYQSMELRTIMLNTTAFTIVNYISPISITVQGDAHLFVNQTWSMTTIGDFTMPANFGGQFSGEITYITSTNRGMILHWIDEAAIRIRRQNYNIETGTPYEAAIRLMPTPSLPSNYTAPRRRWELMVWRMPSEFLSVIFPYVLAFDKLVNLTDESPAPIGHDESVKAACLAVAEKEVEDVIGGPDWTYYRETCLPNSYRVDAMAAPKSLGYFGNPSAGTKSVSSIKQFRDYWYQRPTVPVT